MGKIDVETLSLAKSFAGTDEVKKICLGETELYSSAAPITFPAVPYSASWTSAQVLTNGLQIAHSSSGAIKHYVYSTTSGLYVGICPESSTQNRIVFVSKTNFSGNAAYDGVFYNGSSSGSSAAGAAQLYQGIYTGYTTMSVDFIVEDDIPYFSSHNALLKAAVTFLESLPSGYAGTITNGGYIPAEVFIDHNPAYSSAEYTLTSEGVTISCEEYVIIAEDIYQLPSYVSSTNCTYEAYEFDDYVGYIVYPTASNWTFEAQFVD